MAAALLIWPGSLLHVALVEAGLLVYLLTRSQHSDATHFAARLAVLHGTALILILAFHPGSHWQQWGRFSPVVLTDFQPWLFGSLTAFFIACSALWRLTSLEHGGRWISAIALGAGVLAISATIAPELLQGAGDAWQWFSKDEDFQRSVSESKPLFSSGSRFARVAVLRLSCFIFVFPVAVCLLAWSTRKKSEPATDWMVLGWAFALFAVTLVQKRFFNSFSVALALIMGWSACRLYAALLARGCESRARRQAYSVMVAILFAGLLLPTLRGYERSITNHWYWLNGKDTRLHIVQTRQRAAIDAARWLREQSPPTSGWFDADVQPEYSVLSPWEIGHIIEYEARRPTVADNFGDDLGSKNFALARSFYGSREVKAIKILDQLGVRYVIAEQQPDYLRAKPSRESIGHAMYELDGSESTPSPDAPGEQPIRALKRHRLVYESRRLAFYPTALPPFKIFEYVKGARLSGKAAPGEKIRIAVRLHTNTLREVVYTRTVTASSKGRYTAILPYANRGYSNAVRVDPVYTLDCRSESATVIIDESAVMHGNSVQGPDLCLDASM
jgi:dolichyl-diphosphooligosaccharide--protein glycosyltransferase